MSPVIKKLIEGNQHFRSRFFGEDKALFEALLQGQTPKTLVVSCSDSRVEPAMIFDCQPGDMFAVRNIANLIPPYEGGDNLHHGVSAALEFGTCFLQVEHIIVLGHTQCGGIRALLQHAGNMLDASASNFIAQWMGLAQSAYDRVMAEHSQATLEEQISVCEQYALIHSLENLRSFPWIKEREAQGKLSLHAWCFELSTGLIHRYDEKKVQWIV